MGGQGTAGGEGAVGGGTRKPRNRNEPAVEYSWKGTGKTGTLQGWGWWGEVPEAFPRKVGESKWLMFKEDTWSSFP